MPDTLLHIKLSDIHVVNNHNPRKNFDAGSLKQLSESIAANGVTSPVLVAPIDDGKYQLIAGERRFRAAKLAKCAEIPALVRDDGQERARTLALVENLVREDLDPVEEAESFAALIAENGWTQKQVAIEVGVSTAHVSQRLSLLRLPEAAQRLIATGQVSLDHTKALRDAAAISPEFSAHFAKTIKGEPRIEWDHIIDAERSYKGLAILLFGSVSNDDLVTLLEADSDLSSAIKKHFPNTWDLPRWDDSDVDAARSFGCLIEISYTDRGGHRSTASFATDPDFLVGRLQQKVDRAKQSDRDRAAANGKTGTSGNDSNPASAEELKAAARTEREAQVKARAKARAFNFEIGEKLALQLKEPDFTLERMQLLARVILSSHDNRHLGVASFGLVDEDTVEINDRGSMKIMSLGEATADLLSRVEYAQTPQQVLGVLMQALIASQISDPACLPPSSQPSYHFPGSYDDPPVAERLTLGEALKVFKPGTNTYKKIKAQLTALGG